MFTYRLPLASDLNATTGARAYYAVSFSPERRAESDIAEYVRDVNDFAEYVRDVNDFAAMLEPLATSDAQQAKAAEEVERFRARYAEHRNTIWAATSRTMSPMITGPARFPVARNQKRMDTEEKRIREFLDWLPKAKKSACKAVELVDAPSPVVDTRESTTETIDGVEVVHNFAADRLQLFFGGKPDEETRARLKGAGWRWSPREGAWQRKLTGNATYSARYCITGSRFAMAEA